MSLESKIGKAVLDLGDIIKATVVMEIAKSKSEGRIEMTSDELTYLASIVSNSIDSSVRNGMDGIMRLVK